MKFAPVFLVIFFSAGCATTSAIKPAGEGLDIETPSIPEGAHEPRVDASINTSTTTVDVDMFFLLLARTSTTGKEPPFTFALAEDQISAMRFAIYTKTSETDFRFILYIRDLIADRDMRTLSMVAQSKFVNVISDPLQRAFWHRAIVLATKGMDRDCDRRRFWWESQIYKWNEQERRAYFVTYYYFQTRLKRAYPCAWKKKRPENPLQIL